MSWTEDQIRERVRFFEEEGLGWYQNIDLRNGIATKTRSFWGEDSDHPRRRWGNLEHAVPADLTGRSVLDIGCNAGFTSFEAADRGATDVVGIDLKQGYIDQAKFCGEVRGQPLDFRVGSVYDVDKLGRTFDVVLFIGLLYHCRYLPNAVEAISRVCTDTLICESAIHIDESEIPLIRHLNRANYGGPDSAGAARLPGSWHPNMAAMKSLFYEQGFSSVDVVFREGGRGAVIARR